MKSISRMTATAMDPSGPSKQQARLFDKSVLDSKDDLEEVKIWKSTRIHI